MSRTKVEIIGGISLLGVEKPSVHCREGLMKEMCGRINICTDGYSKEEIAQIEENTKKIQKGSIDTKSRSIYAEENNVCILSKNYIVDTYVCSLEITKKEYIEEILGGENQSVWIEKVGELVLRGYAFELLPKTTANQIQELRLSAKDPDQIKEIRKTESIWVGMMKWLVLDGYAVEILPKLGFHEEN